MKGIKSFYVVVVGRPAATVTATNDALWFKIQNLSSLYHSDLNPKFSPNFITISQIPK